MEQISFSKPTIKRKDMFSVLQTLVDEKITTKSKTLEFSTLFRENFCPGKTHGICYRTYSQAIRQALLALNVQEGVKVAVSFLTPSIWKDIALCLGCEIVLCDVYSKNGCINIEDSNCDIAILYESCGTIAQAQDYENCVVIEDISQSLGSMNNQELTGSIGDIVVCAFEDDQLVSTGGGAIVACSESSYGRLLKEDYELLTDLNASLGLIQMSSYKASMVRRQEISRSYRSNLMKTRHKLFGQGSLDYEGCSAFFPVFLDTKVEEIIKFCRKYGVPVKKAFENVCGENDLDDFELFPVAIPYYHRTLLFPIYPFLKASEIDQIQKVLSHLP